MKSIFYMLLCLLSVQGCKGQENSCVKISPDSTVNLMNTIWALDTTYLFDEGDSIFYKYFILQEHSDELNLEGEISDHLFLLRGRYGEYPDGDIYDLGLYYNIQKIYRQEEQFYINGGTMGSKDIPLNISCTEL